MTEMVVGWDMGQYRIPTANEAAGAQQAGAQRAAGPLVTAAHLDAARGRIVLELDRQCSIAFDPAIYPVLAKASLLNLEEIAILGRGSAINFPRVDVSVSVENLLADLLTAGEDHALTRIERGGEGELVEIAFGSATLRAPRVSEESRARGVEDSRRAMRALADAVLALPGIKLQRKVGVPLFYVDTEDPTLIVRELDGMKQRGRFEDGRFVEV